MSQFDVRVEDTAVVASRRDGETRVGTTGWQPTDATDAPALGNVPVDETRTGYAVELRPPGEALSVRGFDVDLGEHVDGLDAEGLDQQYHISGPVELPPGEYRAQVLGRNVRLYLRFDATDAVDVTSEDDDVRVRFADPTAVTVGVRFEAAVPRDAVQVPPTTEGLARAVSTFPATLRTVGPDRSWPTFRPHPPRVEFGDTVDLGGLPERTPETGIEVAVPDRTAAVLTVTPLSYYLGASVTVEDRERPLVRAPAAGVSRALPAAPDLGRAVAALLHRVHRLDCLVRSAGPHGVERKEERLLAERGVDPDLDPERCYEVSAAERLARYLQADDAVPAAYPPLAQAVVLPDTVRAGRALPHVADRLAAVYTPPVDPPGERVGRPLTVGHETVAWPASGPGGERLLYWAAGEPPWASGDADRPACASTGPVAALERTPVGGNDRIDALVIERAGDPSPATAVETRTAEVEAETAVRRLVDPDRERLRAALREPTDLVVAVPGATDGEALAAAVEDADADVQVGVVAAADPRGAATALVEAGAGAAVGVPREEGADAAALVAGFLVHGGSAADAALLARRHGDADAVVVGDPARPVSSVMSTTLNCSYLFENGSVTSESVSLSMVEGGVFSVWGPTGGGESGVMGTPLKRSIGDDLQAELRQAGVFFYDGRVYWPSEHRSLLNPAV